MNMRLRVYVCSRCGYEWASRKPELPKTCANKKCRSPLWKEPRVRKSGPVRLYYWAPSAELKRKLKSATTQGAAKQSFTLAELCGSQKPFTKKDTLNFLARGQLGNLGSKPAEKAPGRNVSDSN